MRVPTYYWIPLGDWSNYLKKIQFVFELRVYWASITLDKHLCGGVLEISILFL